MAQVQLSYEALDACIKDYGFDKHSDTRMVYNAALIATGSFAMAWAVTDRVKQMQFYKGFCEGLN